MPKTFECSQKIYRANPANQINNHKMKTKKKEKPGPKPKGEKKAKQIQIYKAGDAIESKGGIVRVREELSKKFDQLPNVKKIK